LPASPIDATAAPIVIVERRLSAHLDWPLIAAVLGLTAIGLATIYSVTWDVRRGQPGPEFWTQVYAVPVSLAALTVCLLFDYRTLAQRSLALYAALVLALLGVHFFGVVRGGARRWIPLGSFSLQPSEFARIGVALVLAMFYGESRRSAKSIGELAIGAVLVAVPAYLILKQPDVGTAATLVPVLLGVIFLAGLRVRWLVIGVVVFALLSPIIWKFGLKDYQRGRIVTFIDPEQDPRGAGYQQIQARVTVGSGGLVGKGFRGSTQGSGGFLPAAHNDFAFSVLAEEHGFVGVLAALGLYMFVITRSLDAAKLAKDRVGAYLVAAIVSGFAFQVLYNITMSAGLAPVKGLTLPLISYGGSSLVATFAGFGLILNVRMRRFTN
jgi:rod shape determining protein RodA